MITDHEFEEEKQWDLKGVAPKIIRDVCQYVIVNAWGQTGKCCRPKSEHVKR